MNRMVYVLVISNFNELEVECPHDDIIGVYNTFEKAKAKMQELISVDIKEYDFVYDENNVDKILVGDKIRVFEKEQENWSCYSEYRILERVIE